MTATRAFARALSASLCFGVGAGELARRKTLEEATAEARVIARVHRCKAYVYRQDGCFKASQLEGEFYPDAEFIAEVMPEPERLPPWTDPLGMLP
jgi:hypothetical protein